MRMSLCQFFLRNNHYTGKKVNNKTLSKSHMVRIDHMYRSHAALIGSLHADSFKKQDLNTIKADRNHADQGDTC